MRVASSWIAVALAACASRAVAESVRINHEEGGWRVRTEACEVVVDGRGHVHSLKVFGSEFLPPRGKVRAGGYFYQGGVLELPDVRQEGESVLTATSEKAAVSFLFRHEAMEWKLTNKTNQAMEFVLLFDPAVSAVQDPKGALHKPPVTGRWEKTTWFCGKSKLTLSGGSKQWGPFLEVFQVWTSVIPAGETKTLTLTPGHAGGEEGHAAAAAPAPAATAKGPETYARIERGPYVATVTEDGALASLKIDGTEMVHSAPYNPRGAYLWQKGPLKLNRIRRPQDDVIIASNDRAEVRYDFGEDTIVWTATNHTPQPLLCLIVFDRDIDAVHGENDWWAKPPVTFPWQRSTWFHGSANLTLDGSTRVWGPWANHYQVWESRVETQQTRKIEMKINSASDDERKKAAEIAAAPPPPPPSDPDGPMWDMDRLSAAPRTLPAEDFAAEGLRGLFYGGLPFQGRPTRVFAWLGLPKAPAGQKVPGMVLVHGGGGTAFADWVQVWNRRGYAAIAMDTCGCLPAGEHGRRPRHPHGGPPGWGGWNQIDWPREDQWTYHAVADVILAHSLLRSLPQVDPDRIGITGISWGGYLTSIVAGVDARFKLAVPVYGCGFTNEHGFAGRVQALGKEKGDRWMRWWDPSVYLPNAKMPMLWVSGSNDFAYTLNALQKSYRLPKGPRTLSIRLRMPHGQQPGSTPEEIRVFADSILKKGQPLATITGQGREGYQCWVTYRSAVPIINREFNFTRQTGKWQDRKWESAPAQETGPGRMEATLPEGTTVYYFNLTDNRGCVVSSEHVEVGG